MERRRERDKHLHTALFTMLIALLMLCFQRAHVVVSLAEQWRARIFILLNLLLLAVLFTSHPFTRASSNDEENSREEEAERSKKVASKRRRDMDVVITSSYAEELCEFSRNNKSTSCNNNVFVNKVDDEVSNERVEDVEFLSEEELNRRVEAFISMFKQHLLSDSKRKSRFAAASRSRGSMKQLI